MLPIQANLALDTPARATPVTVPDVCGGRPFNEVLRTMQETGSHTLLDGASPTSLPVETPSPQGATASGAPEAVLTASRTQADQVKDLGHTKKAGNPLPAKARSPPFDLILTTGFGTSETLPPVSLRPTVEARDLNSMRPSEVQPANGATPANSSGAASSDTLSNNTTGSSVDERAASWPTTPHTTPSAEKFGPRADIQDHPSRKGATELTAQGGDSPSPPSSTPIGLGLSKEISTSPASQIIPYALTTSTSESIPSPIPIRSVNTPAPIMQLASGLLTLAGNPQGSQQLVVRLHPVELGMVQVRIEKSSSGPTRVEVTADNIDTLRNLKQDEPRLHHVLTEAGFSTSGHVISFHMSQPPSGASSGPEPDMNSRTNDSGAKARGDGSDAGPQADRQSGFGEKNRRPEHDSDEAVIPTKSSARDADMLERTYRLGLDITA